MAIQVRNSEMVALLSGDFQLRYEPNFAWKSACSQFLALAGSRGFWPMSSFNSAGNAENLNGQTRTLTYNGNPVYGVDGLAPYIELDGTGDYLSRTDEADLDIIGSESYVAAAYQGLTIAGWGRFSNVAGAAEYMLSKWDAAGNQRSYVLYRTAGGLVSFVVSNDGTATTGATTTTGPAQNEWFFAAGRFDNANNELKAWYNDATNTAVYNNLIHSGTANLVLGGNHAAGNLMTGRLSLWTLCAAAQPDAVIFQLFHQSRAMFGV